MSGSNPTIPTKKNIMKKAIINLIFDINLEVSEEDFDSDDPTIWTKIIRKHFEDAEINLGGFFKEQPHRVRAKLKAIYNEIGSVK